MEGLQIKGFDKYWKVIIQIGNKKIFLGSSGWQDSEFIWSSRELAIEALEKTYKEVTFGDIRIGEEFIQKNKRCIKVAPFNYKNYTFNAISQCNTTFSFFDKTVVERVE